MLTFTTSVYARHANIQIEITLIQNIFCDSDVQFHIDIIFVIRGISFKSSINDKILHMPELKSFATKLKLNLPAFYPFSKMFSKGYLLRVVKNRDSVFMD